MPHLPPDGARPKSARRALQAEATALDRRRGGRRRRLAAVCGVAAALLTGMLIATAQPASAEPGSPATYGPSWSSGSSSSSSTASSSVPTISELVDSLSSSGYAGAPTGRTGFEGSPEVGPAHARAVNESSSTWTPGGSSNSSTDSSNLAQPALAPAGPTSIGAGPTTIGAGPSTLPGLDLNTGRAIGTPSSSGRTGFEGSPEIGPAHARAVNVASSTYQPEPTVLPGRPDLDAREPVAPVAPAPPPAAIPAQSANAAVPGRTGFEGSPEVGPAHARAVTTGSSTWTPAAAGSAGPTGFEGSPEIGPAHARAVNVASSTYQPEPTVLPGRPDLDVREPVTPSVGIPPLVQNVPPPGTGVTGFEGSPEVGPNRAARGSAPVDENSVWEFTLGGGGGLGGEGTFGWGPAWDEFYVTGMGGYYQGGKVQFEARPPREPGWSAEGKAQALTPVGKAEATVSTDFESADASGKVSVGPWYGGVFADLLPDPSCCDLRSGRTQSLAQSSGLGAVVAAGPRWTSPTVSTRDMVSWVGSQIGLSDSQPATPAPSTGRTGFEGSPEVGPNRLPLASTPAPSTGRTGFEGSPEVGPNRLPLASSAPIIDVPLPERSPVIDVPLPQRADLNEASAEAAEPATDVAETPAAEPAASPAAVEGSAVEPAETAAPAADEAAPETVEEASAETPAETETAENEAVDIPATETTDTETTDTEAAETETVETEAVDTVWSDTPATEPFDTEAPESESFDTEAFDGAEE